MARKSKFKDRSEEAAEQFDLDAEEGSAPDPGPQSHGPDGDGAERRSQPRTTCGIIVQVSHKNVEDFVEHYAINISSGGMFIRSYDPLPRDSDLSFEIQLADGKPVLRGKAKVAWNKTPAPDRKMAVLPGMGVKFTELDESSRDIVDRIVAHKLAELEERVEPSAVGEKHTDGEQPAEQPPEISAAETAQHLAPRAEEDLPEESIAEARPRPANDKKSVVDALMTALRIGGAIAEGEGGTIRYLLEAWFAQYYEDGEVDLTMLWNTLIADEAISVENAALPILVFQQARTGHGYRSRLPAAMDDMAGREQLVGRARDRIRSCGGFASVLERVAAEPKPEPPSEAVEKEEKPPPGKRVSKKSRRLSSGKAKKIVAVVAALGVVVLLFFSLSYLFPPRAEEFIVSPADGNLKIEQAVSDGSKLSAVIIDEFWDEMDETKRREAVAKLAGNLHAEGIVGLILYDKNFIPAATASITSKDSPPQVKLGDEIWKHYRK